MRIAVGSLLQGTNTFAPTPTRLEHFQIAEDDELLEHAARERTEVAGFLDAVREGGAGFVPLLGGWAVSYGRIVRDDYENLIGRLLTRLREAGPVDGVLLALHGAWAAEGFDSADGELLWRVRLAVGDGVPVVASLDMHANLSRAMWANADALVGYRTCPHVDTYETGRRAAALILGMADSRAGRHRYARAMRKLPMAVQAEEMMSDRGVFKRLLDHA